LLDESLAAFFVHATHVSMSRTIARVFILFSHSQIQMRSNVGQSLYKRHHQGSMLFAKMGGDRISGFLCVPLRDLRASLRLRTTERIYRRETAEDESRISN